MYFTFSSAAFNISIALSSIYGIGLQNSFYICKSLGFAPNLKVKNLTKKQVYDLIIIIESSNIIISTDLKKYRLLINKRLVSIKSYKSFRKLKGLPIRASITYTNVKSSRKVKKIKNTF